MHYYSRGMIQPFIDTISTRDQPQYDKLLVWLNRLMPRSRVKCTVANQVSTFSNAYNHQKKNLKIKNRYALCFPAKIDQNLFFDKESNEHILSRVINYSLG